MNPEITMDGVWIIMAVGIPATVGVTILGYIYFFRFLRRDRDANERDPKAYYEKHSGKRFPTDALPDDRTDR